MSCKTKRKLTKKTEGKARPTYKELQTPIFIASDNYKPQAIGHERKSITTNRD
jgi:hypothetical protein